MAVNHAPTNQFGMNAPAPTPQKRDSSTQSGIVSLNLSGGGGQQSSGGSGGGGFTFPIRPEQFQLDWPARQTVTQTITGAYQDHWGNGIGQITLSGHTGWRKQGGSDGDGYEAFMKLRGIHDKYCQMCGDGDPADVTLELVVAVPKGFGHYRVSSDRFRTLKSTNGPLLYRYEMQMTVIKDLGADQQGSTSTGQALAANNVTTTGTIQNSNDTLNSRSSQLLSLGDNLLQPQTIPYVVRPGDTTASIASSMLGDANLAPLIANANPNRSLSPLIVGTVINIPTVGVVLL